MSLKIFNKLINLSQKEEKQQIICQLVKGSLHCKLANINELEQKVYFNVPETLDFLDKLKDNNLNENKSIRLQLADKYYRLNINIRSKQEININITKNKPEIRDLSHLGFNQKQSKSIKLSLKGKKGLIIITGPQFSGKSTSYYSFLNYVNNSQKLCYSIEKYPSLKLANINQFKFQTNTFSKIKKSDAEIIGFDHLENYTELEELLYLANSGRLVIACLEKEKAVQALHFISKSNLPFNLITDNLKTIVAQKILKKNCPKCLNKLDVNKKWLKKIKDQSHNTAKNTWYSSSGCPDCQYSGKDKSIPCFEIMNINKQGGLKAGFKPLIYDAVAKANNGLFSPEEISQLLK